MNKKLALGRQAGPLLGQKCGAGCVAHQPVGHWLANGSIGPVTDKEGCKPCGYSSLSVPMEVDDENPNSHKANLKAEVIVTFSKY